MGGLESASEVEATAPAPTFADIIAPLLLLQGAPVAKVSNNRRRNFMFKLDPELRVETLLVCIHARLVV